MTALDTLTVRACTSTDVAAVLALVRAEEERASGASRLLESDVKAWWLSVDLAEDSWLVTAPGQSTPVAVAWLERSGPELGFAVPLAPAAPATTLSLLVDLVESRAARLGLARLHVAVVMPHPPAAELLTSRGYQQVRRFIEMAIELDGPPPVADLPAGFSLHAVTPEDGRAFHAATSEAFEDHWEHHHRPFEAWWDLHAGDDLSWWFVVRDGDRTAAAIRNESARNGGIYVATLGVRRPWRGLGLGRALLRHTFRRAWQVGVPRLTLGVDASSPTGATALYRSVGMVTEQQTAIWEKHLATAEPAPVTPPPGTGRPRR